MLQMGLTPQQIIPFLTDPAVRELTDQLVENDVSTLGQIGVVNVNGTTINVPALKRDGGSSVVNLDNPADMTNENLVLALEVLAQVRREALRQLGIALEVVALLLVDDVAARMFLGDLCQSTGQ